MNNRVQLHFKNNEEKKGKKRINEGPGYITETRDVTRSLVCVGIQ